jgi:hypothetical protein
MMQKKIKKRGDICFCDPKKRTLLKTKNRTNKLAREILLGPF